MLSVAFSFVFMLNVIMVSVVAPFKACLSFSSPLQQNKLERLSLATDYIFSRLNGTAHFEKCKQLSEYQKVTLT